MDINVFISEVKNLPPSPEILPKLQKLLGDENANTADIASLLKLDAPLATQVIRVSNSSYYASTEPAVKIEDAINRIGFKDVHKIVGVISSQNVFGDSQPLYHTDKNELWEQSIRCAALMFTLGRSIGIDADTAYTVGLIHSIGKIIINNYYMENGLEGYWVEDYPNGLCAAGEEKLLGFNHADLGGALLEKWKFPEVIYLAVANQMKPLESEKALQITSLLSLSKLAISQLQEDPETLYDHFQPNEDELKAVGLDAETLITAALDSESTFEWLANTI